MKSNSISRAPRASRGFQNADLTRAVGRLEQLDAVALADMARTHDRGVQREPAVTPIDDALKRAMS